MLMCACMILAIPFLVPAPNMTEEAKELQKLIDELKQEEA